MTAARLTGDLGLLPGVEVRVGEPLARHTSFKVGGPADYYVEAHTSRGLTACLRLLERRGVPVLLLGNGSNLLVSDLGVRGAVLRLRGEFRRVRWRTGDAGADVGAACAVSRLVREAVRRGLGGLEFAEGIPGSVGGSLVMNAGAYGSEMERVVTRVDAVTAGGEPMALGREELRFSYRQARLPDGAVVTRVGMALTPETTEAVDARMRAVMAQRRASQPSGHPNFGSVFRNPPDDRAGRLIEAAGLKGLRVGAAEVSRRHANFILNRGGARAEDVRRLIEQVCSTVERRFSVALQTEVRFVGEWRP